MAKFLCMEIGTSTVRLAEVNRRGKSVEITKVFMFDTPDDAMKDGKVRISDSIVGAIRDGIDRSGIKTTDVYFVVESTKILFKQVEIPFVQKRQIQSTLELSFTDYFPVDETLYHVSYVLEKIYDKNGHKMMALDVFAIPNDLSESYYNLSVALNLNAKGLTDTSRSMISLFPDSFKNRNIAMVNLNERTSTLTISLDGDMVFNKTIPYGVEGAIQQVINSPLTFEGLTVTDACEQLYDKEILMKQMPESLPENPDEKIQLRFNTTTSIVSLIKAIEQTFTAFLAKNNIQIQEFHLSGLGAGFAGISQLLAYEFGIPVTVMQQDGNLKVADSAANETILLGCYPCVGAAIDSANFFTADEKRGGDLAKRKKIDKYFVVGGILILTASAVFSLGSWLEASTKLQDVEAEHSRLSKKVQNMRDLGVEVAYNNYVTAQSYNEQVKVLYQDTQSGNEEMTIFLEELENTLPTSARVTSINITPASAEVGFVCQDKFVAAGVLHLLRNMDTIHSMECSGVAELDNSEEIGFVCTFTLKSEADRQGIVYDEFGNPITPEENPDQTPEEDVGQEEEIEVDKGYLAQTTKKNTDSDFSIVKYGEITLDMNYLHIDTLNQGGFSIPEGSIFSIENDALMANGLCYVDSNGVEFDIVDKDGVVQLFSTTNAGVEFFGGLHVGLTRDEITQILPNETIEIVGERYIILKNDTHTLVLMLDFMDHNIVDAIFIMTDEWTETLPKPTTPGNESNENQDQESIGTIDPEDNQNGENPQEQVPELDEGGIG